MVYYYSGTGNSAYTARELSRMTGEKYPPVSIPQALNNSGLDIYTGEYLGFVFPIYSWGVPPIVLHFIEKLPKDLFEGRYVWAVCTCGDEAGVAMRKFSKAIEQVRGEKPDLCMSLIMPNNYVLLPGFDVDKEEVADRKLSEAPRTLRNISDIILKKESNIFKVKEGSMPHLRSLAYPLFKKWGINPKKWNVDDNCISCGKCCEICTVNNINLDSEGHPTWGKNCLSCCACYHVCPKKAINYGKATQRKGQYLFPGYPFRG